MSEFKTIGIVVKTDAAKAHDISAKLIQYLHARNLKVLLTQSGAEFLGSAETCVPDLELGKHCDLVIALGGDGTMLAAGRNVAAFDVPLLGINLGRLGFMTEIAPETISESLNRIFDGEFSIEKRFTLDAQDLGKDEAPRLAINDVVVRHRRYVRMLDFNTYADAQFISQHRADGVIASTPTGSTAYALSAGGPMLHPSVAGIALVPISPHTLSDRPLILSADTQLEIEISERPENEALYTCDGQIDTDLEPGARLLIRRSAHALRLVHHPDHDYFGILRDKLSWGRNRT